MKIAGFVQDSIVDGPGLRFTLFLQGCPHQCPGCHNPETHDTYGGSEISTEELAEKITSNPLTDGITISGGEPFMQPKALIELLEQLKGQYNVWIYSGYEFEKLLTLGEDVEKLLSLCNVLVDGPFIECLKSYTSKWRGSSNQRVIDVQESLKRNEPVLLIE